MPALDAAQRRVASGAGGTLTSRPRRIASHSHIKGLDDEEFAKEGNALSDNAAPAR